MDFESDAYMSEAESDFNHLSDDDFYSDQENSVIPAPKKGNSKTKAVAVPKVAKKKAVGTTGDARKALATKSSITNIVRDEVNEVSKPKNNKTIEEIYQKKTQLEHILLRPDTYSKSKTSCFSKSATFTNVCLLLSLSYSWIC